MKGQFHDQSLHDQSSRPPLHPHAAQSRQPLLCVGHCGWSAAVGSVRLAAAGSAAAPDRSYSGVTEAGRLRISSIGQREAVIAPVPPGVSLRAAVWFQRSGVVRTTVVGACSLDWPFSLVRGLASQKYFISIALCGMAHAGALYCQLCRAPHKDQPRR